MQENSRFSAKYQQFSFVIIAYLYLVAGCCFFLRSFSIISWWVVSRFLGVTDTPHQAIAAIWSFV
jgi:hypothetical protein